MPDPIKSTKSLDPSQEATRNRYLNSDKKFDVNAHLDKLKKEELSGLKGIEVRATPKQLGKDDFLRLLLTQLSKQDPTNPMKDQDFIAQMAQFSSLEQMKNISTSMQKLEMRQSYMLVGKVVSGPDFVNGETVTGLVGAIFFDGENKPFVRVNGRAIEVDKINFISDPSIMKTEELENNFSNQEKVNSQEKETSRWKEKSDGKEFQFPGSETNKRNAYK
ncbi:MAG: flagellar hook capping FlgD N-terminal domain-containing protein [Leptospiraceae bacterium]|nr:flagellar hook capping FlgD N-terminal domain-containing protein [Leptospiraceae bacterium]